MDPPGRAADELGFLVRRRLIVHPPKRPAAGAEGNTALLDPGIQTVLLELAAAPGPREEPTLVVVELQIKEKCPSESQRREDHATTSGWGMGTANRPHQTRTYASCSMTSSLRFQARIRTTSGLVSRIRSGETIGMCVPGRYLPCL